MKTLHRAKGLSHELVVTRDGSTVTLWSAEGVRHTVLDLNSPHIPGLEYARNTLIALAFTPEADSILILGLGGGSIPRMLRAARPSASIDAVEVDPAIPEIARRFFNVGDAPRFQVHMEDAAEYVASCIMQYDIIVLDAYLGESLPRQCSSRDFFDGARRCLTESGVLVINWMPGDHERYRSLLGHVAGAIGPAWTLPGQHTRNLLVFAPVRRTSRQQLLEGAERLERVLPFAAPIARVARRLKPAC